ncbi:unnamed protein product [Coregonus sp. 'balchen']|nr:unnamed protein product [Coregonus sp. 'balchen']
MKRRFESLGCRSGEGDVYTCECSVGYEGEKCEQATLDPLDLLPVSNWDPATPPAPEQATPATPTTATQPSQTTTVSTTTQAPPTLQPWQPKAGQRLLVVQWEKQQICTVTTVSSIVPPLRQTGPGITHVHHPILLAWGFVCLKKTYTVSIHTPDLFHILLCSHASTHNTP